MSEIRAPGGLLLIAGVYLLHQALVSRHLRSALLFGAGVFGAYGIARLLSIFLDGVPSTSLIAATSVELVVSALLLGLAQISRGGTASGRTAR